MAQTENAPIVSKIARQYLRLQLTSELGPVRLRRLLARFGSIQALLSASMSALQKVEGVGPKTAESIFQARTNDAVEREIERAAEENLHFVCWEDVDFPEALRNIPDAPICIYIRGRLEPTDAVAIAIVGTRRCSHYGREQAVRFGEMLGGAGFTVISGLARGVDGHAHRGALQAGGRTIAVLGNGLGTIYPPEHQGLAEDIAQSGTLISEVPIDMQPTAENFPRRNRIIAGLALGVIVIEAGSRSGALITARLASEYNREVFAVPGRVDRPELTAGVHRLIREGEAKLITSLEDVLDELGDVGRILGTTTSAATTAGDSRTESTAPQLATLSQEERAVFDALADEELSADSIVENTDLEMARIMSVLTALQLNGLVTQLPGNQFTRRKPQGNRKNRS